MMRIAPAIALLLTACATSAATSDAGTPIGRTVRVAGVAITPLAVLEDSRCPSDILCVHAGNFVLLVDVAGEGQKKLAIPAPTPISGGRILILESVMPGRKHRQPPVPLQAYRFSFRIGKAS